MSRRPVQPNQIARAYLYEVVFNARITKLVVLFIFAVMLLQPIGSAYASELEDVPTVVPQEVTESAAEVEEEPEPAVEEEVDEAQVSETEEEVVINEGDDTAEVPLTETPEQSGSSESVDDTTDETTGSSNTSTSDQSATGTEAVEDETVRASSSDADVDVSTESPATTTTSSSASSTDTNAGSGSNGDTTSEDTDTTTVGTTTATSSESVATTTATTTATTETDPVVTEPEPVVAGEESTDEATSTTVEVEIQESAVESDTASTTEVEPAVSVPVTASLTNDENRHQFAKTECISVGDGAFYCQKTLDESTGVNQNMVYADYDQSGGDREIFLRVDGVSRQVTNNSFDDMSPYFDEAGNQVVWHRLIDGRYQIIRYDIDSDMETQLTDTRDNNMEPVQADGVTAWQRWIDGDWDIVVLRDGEETVITDNTAHDVAPAIRDGHVMWHTTSESGEKVLSVYSLEDGITSLINDPDGGQVENPRYVLVYDTTFENGDRVTKQYDPLTGEITPVGTDPAPLPAPAIPEPDTTGETRALIQNKTSNPEDELLDLIASSTKSGGAPDSDNEQISVATSTVAGEENIQTLDLATSTDASDEVLPLTEFDVIVEPYSKASSTQTTDSASTSDSVE